MSTPFSSIESAIEAIRQGRMVVVVDDEDRENEGDLTLAAEHVTPEAIAFMATHGRGLICTALEGPLLDHLHIPQMVQDNTSPFETAFCVSVEAREGTSTGISAHDRSRTIQALVAPGAKATDFVKPGHVFPLRAKPGGVLARTGQTEASVDLARLAGLHPSGVICEIMKDDGTMARVPDLVPFCQKFDLPLVTVAALVAHRLRVDPIIRRVGTTVRETAWGTLKVHRFESLLDGSQHFAYVLGEVEGGPAPLVRVHQETLPDDLDGFGKLAPTPFHEAMDAIRTEGRGVLVYLRRPGTDPEIPPQAPLSDRDVGVGAHILVSLGVKEMRLLSRAEKKYIGLRGFGLDIVGHVHLDAH
ncbi:3,4-dihydroxy-2-butanone-4-phosphate synthase [Mesoterricola silvestris]|uniref:3,4-dihydroxy-2-butanone 4-phosphate synthase n=1 Tax=Mesoterricola silvestris TaxID=2927979 RepID=A0AA48GUQ7_9BACT|nr:3,4-dihydroxy-2-butanone-4-phosphate synthase [Mesoterricola silvestris]BDU74417.1 riboflavin biosynthesis protein RibBA [Mesoterricola silvestris]